MLLSKCELCNIKKLKFIKEQVTSGLLGSLEMKTPLNPLNNIPYYVLFCFKSIQQITAK